MRTLIKFVSMASSRLLARPEKNPFDMGDGSSSSWGKVKD